MKTDVEADNTAAWQAADPVSLADSATVDGLLRCWIRENDLSIPVEGPIHLELANVGVRLHVDVLYWSATGFHHFGQARWATGAPVTAVMLAALLVSESGAQRGTDPSAVNDLVARVADSENRVAQHIRHHLSGPPPELERSPFLAAEQALVYGHPLHPAPKSRIGWSEGESQTFSPELHGRFRLNWFVADTSIVSRSDRAAALLSEFSPGTPEGTVAIPVHPWQVREVFRREETRKLVDAGLLRDLGPLGTEWYPTASIRTVYSPRASIMLKLSLGLPITNSKRENLRKELRRGEEIDWLLDAGLECELAATFPRFRIVRDPGWVTVNTSDGQESGLELVIRANPFREDDRVACVAGLTAEQANRGMSQLGTIISRISAVTGESTGAIAEEWCERYFDEVIAPVLWLHQAYGLGLETHQQNTVVVLDPEGWPSGGWYRDNQGYYISETRAGELDRLLPGVGSNGENRCADAVIDERLGYYIGINNLLGVVGALGSQKLADESRLLRMLRGKLLSFPESSLARTLARASTLRCKANLLTRVDNLDELVGPLETQSVYRDMTNPITEVSASS